MATIIRVIELPPKETFFADEITALGEIVILHSQAKGFTPAVLTLAGSHVSIMGTFSDVIEHLRTLHEDYELETTINGRTVRLTRQGLIPWHPPKLYDGYTHLEPGRWSDSHFMARLTAEGLQLRGSFRRHEGALKEVGELPSALRPAVDRSWDVVMSDRERWQVQVPLIVDRHGSMYLQYRAGHPIEKYAGLLTVVSHVDGKPVV